MEVADEMGIEAVTTVIVTLPDKLSVEVENYVKSGWFTDEAELLRTALQEFICRNRFKMMDKCMKEDIEWAVKVIESAQ